MRREILYAPLSQGTDIKSQIRDYLQYGTPLKPIVKTEIIIPPETKQFARELLFITAGAILGGVILYRIL